MNLLGMFFSIVGLGIWVGGLVTVIILLSDITEKRVDRFKKAIGAFLTFGIMGAVFSIGGNVCPIRNIVPSYCVPTSIVKTNNMTIVNHMVNGKVVVNFVNGGADYWNSTNIMIKVEVGKNFYGYERVGEYRVVTSTE